MTYKLTVIQAFGGYALGDDITEPDAIAAALETHAPFVVRTLVNRPAALDLYSPPPVKGRKPRGE